MQVVFTIEEFRLLVHILRAHAENDPHPATSLQSAAAGLLEKVLARDFCFGIDELEDLEEILKSDEAKMRLDLAGRHTPEQAHDGELLERILDRVTEACAMG